MEPPARDEWGPLFWRLIHLQAISYADEPSEKEKAAARAYFAALANFLPCPECMEHFQALLKELPVEPHLGSCKQLTDWTHELHNRVNRRLGKAEITRQEFYKLYANDEAGGRALRFAGVGELQAPSSAPAPPPAVALPRAPDAKKVPAQPPKAQRSLPPAVPRSVHVPAHPAQPQARAVAAGTAVSAVPAQPKARTVPARPSARMGKRTLKVGPRKPIGFRATGCPTCK